MYTISTSCERLGTTVAEASMVPAVGLVNELVDGQDASLHLRRQPRATTLAKNTEAGMCGIGRSCRSAVFNRRARHWSYCG
jgi:hypothetical protein